MNPVAREPLIQMAHGLIHTSLRMDFKGLAGKYLRLRDELIRATDAGHRQRVIEEMTRLERRLATAGVLPFADTLPLGEA